MNPVGIQARSNKAASAASAKPKCQEPSRAREPTNAALGSPGGEGKAVLRQTRWMTRQVRFSKEKSDAM